MIMCIRRRSKLGSRRRTKKRKSSNSNNWRKLNDPSRLQKRKNLKALKALQLLLRLRRRLNQRHHETNLQREVKVLNDRAVGRLRKNQPYVIEELAFLSTMSVIGTVGSQACRRSEWTFSTGKVLTGLRFFYRILSVICSSLAMVSAIDCWVPNAIHLTCWCQMDVWCAHVKIIWNAEQPACRPGEHSSAAKNEHWVRS